MGQTTILVMILTIISKIFGFVRESVMAAFIGAGDLKSIYTTATTIPTLLTNVVAIGIASGFIPIYNKVKNEKYEEKANEFTSNVINIMMIYGLIILLIVFIFASPISKLLSPDLQGESLKLAKNYTRIIILSIFALLYGSVMKGYLNIKGNFKDPAIVGILLNIIIIISTILTGIFKNPYIIIIGALFAYIFQYIRFPFKVKEAGFKYKMKVDFSDKYIKALLIIVIPVIMSSAADHISIIIDNAMASGFFGVASVSKIFYAKTMLNFIMGVVTISVTTVTFPEIARLGQAGKIDMMKNKVGSAVVFSMILVIPATLGMMALSNPIIKLAFERNAFTYQDTLSVSSLLISYGPYIIFASLTKILSNGFYSVGDSKTPVIIILIQQVINFIMNILLSKLIGINGLALSTSISTAVSSILMILAFNNKFGKIDSDKNIKSVIKIIVSATLMCLIAVLSFRFFIKMSPLIISLGLSVIFAVLIYLIAVILLKVPELNQLIVSFKEKINRSK